MEVYRGLAGERPDAFRPDLATSLNNLSLELRTWEEALAAIEEAVAIRRQLAARWLAAFQPALARSLLNRADILDRLQRTAEADASRAEAAKLVERGDACRGDGDHGRLPTDAWCTPAGRAGGRDTVLEDADGGCGLQLWRQPVSQADGAGTVAVDWIVTALPNCFTRRTTSGAGSAASLRANWEQNPRDMRC